MRRFLPFLILLAVPAPAAAASPAKARLLGCETALRQADRSASFEGDMRRVAGTARMQMRFTLRARTPDRTGWTRVAAPGWDTWLTSDPGKLRYVYDKTVENLPAPAAYRASIRFRWLAADGTVVESMRRSSPACRQPDPRADLRVGPVEYVDGRYLVPLRNAGRAIATSFDVVLQVDGTPQPARSVASLLPGDRTILAFDAPPCARSIGVTVDARDSVEESDEADNTVAVPCGDL